MSASISPFQKIIYSVVSLANMQAFASKFYSPKNFMPRIFIPRLANGAGITTAEAIRLLDGVPSLGSKLWTEYWKNVGQKFETNQNYRAASMSYIMGCFPKENFPWKTEINELKRKSFRKWCESTKAPFEECNAFTRFGKIRYYLAKPPNLKTKSPVTIFLNGLEGSAEEFAFPLHRYLGDTAFASLSIPGSEDYERPMTANSDDCLREVIDDICKKPWVDPNKIGMVGFSFGAYWTFICAKKDSRIKFSLCNGIPYKHTFNPQFSFGLNPIIAHSLICMFGLKHPIQLMGPIQKLYRQAEKLLKAPSGPILFINGDNDTIVDPRDTMLVAEQTNSKVLWIKDDDHCGLFHFERMVSIIVAWTKRCLKDLPASSSEL